MMMMMMLMGGVRAGLLLMLVSVAVFVFVLALSPPALARNSSHPTSANCTEIYFEQYIDHFNWARPLGGHYKYQQRYFICDQFADLSNPATPIFFYFGNEDDVTLYVNNTGLMWENAPSFKALLVFAEHRYYGKSKPFPVGTPGCMDWLTTEQAMADDAVLIRHLKSTLNLDDAPVIGFGGSYGGMLAVYFRRKYPTVVHGVIAGSAPVWAFSGLTPPYDYYGFNAVIARDAANVSIYCRANYRGIQPRIVQLAQTAEGRAMLQEELRLCHPVKGTAAAYDIVAWTQNAWAYMAMGNFPYPSGYIVHGRGELPAFPITKACAPLSVPSLLQDDRTALSALRSSMDVYYNYTHNVPCFNLDPTTTAATNAPLSSPSSPPPPPRMGHHPRHLLRRYPLRGPEQCTGDWGYQFCTEMVMPSSQGSTEDMFWPPLDFNITETAEQCRQQWGVTPRPLWAALNLANKDLSEASNMVLSNGGMDPWHAGGVLHNVSNTVLAVHMPNGAHHLDLMFSNPADPPDVLAARQLEVRQISAWIKEHRVRYAQ